MAEKIPPLLRHGEQVQSGVQARKGQLAGLNLLAKLKDPPPDAALRCAAEAEGVQLSLLSDYDLTGEAPSAAGTLVLGYGSLKDEACASVGETLKKVCMAAREASVTV